MVPYKYGYLYEEESVRKGILIEYDGGVITNSELYSEQFELHESLYSDSFIRFGACEANYVKFRVARDVGKLKGKRITVKYILEGDSEKYFQVGVYTVQSDTPSADRRYRDIIAYDDMYKLIHTDVKSYIKNNITFPIAAYEMRFSILEHLGIENGDTSFYPCDEYLIYGIADDADSISGQTIVEATLEPNCAFGNIDRFGAFQGVTLQRLTERELYPSDHIYPTYGQFPREESTVYIDGWHNKYDYRDGKIYFDIWDKFIFGGKEYFTFYEPKQEMYIEFEDFDPGCRLCCMMDEDDYIKDTNQSRYCSVLFYYLKDGVIFGMNSQVNSYVDGELVTSTLRVYKDKIYDTNTLRKITGLPCFEDEESMRRYMLEDSVLGCVNWNGTYKYKRDLCAECKYEDYFVPDIQQTSIQTNTEENTILRLYNSGTRYSMNSNIFIYGEGDTNIKTNCAYILGDFLKNVNTFSGSVPVEASIRGNPCIRLGDSVRINARLGTFDTYITKRTLSGIQNLKDSIEFKAQEEFNGEIL